jgi:hypothetical protein
MYRRFESTKQTAYEGKSRTKVVLKAGHFQIIYIRYDAT